MDPKEGFKILHALTSSLIQLDAQVHVWKPSSISLQCTRSGETNVSSHRGDMVCEIMADTLLYGIISLLTACTTLIVPAFYRLNELYEHRRGKFYTAGIETFRSSVSVPVS
jgi:hypothetical protein